jgi:putative endonuclease
MTKGLLMRDPDKRYYVYIMASLSGTLYIGVTNSVGRRCDEHKSGAGSSFTSRYKVDRLVYYEVFQYVNNAITREKQLKGWRLTVRDGCFATLNRVCTPNIGNRDSSLHSEGQEYGFLIRSERQRAACQSFCELSNGATGDMPHWGRRRA